MAGFESISTLAKDDEYDVYVAAPAGTPKGAIIVLQEVFGVNEGIRRKCDKLTAEGWLAMAPDLFWRLERRVELDPDVEAEFQKGIALIQKFDQDLAIQDIEAAIQAARVQVNGGKVGCVGYCMGGRLAFMAAARTDVDASVGYYGVGIDGLLREAHAIAHPVMLHIPTADGFVSAEAQAKMHEGLDDHPKVTLHDYEGLDHGFATEMGERRMADAADLADRRTAAFFEANLS